MYETARRADYAEFSQRWPLREGGVRSAFVARLFGDDDESVAIRSDDARRSYGAFDVEMLMTVKKPTRVRRIDVAIEGGEADLRDRKR